MPPGPTYRRIEGDESTWRHLVAQEWDILADLPKWQEDMLRDRRRRPPEGARHALG